ncbi:TPA: hypothetical protein ACGCHN_004309 [Stenotrophomonas maltophilia]|uniref:hypothetical protein n=1 Tax=Stenotrophomonas maltophilia TaxID=40324 RepID=UPI000C151CF6|nr:hypothetical protein [Stenotrophomonas maltophilia]
MSNDVNDDVQAHADSIAEALRSLKPNEQHRKSQLFSLLYPVISDLLQHNVTQKSILEKLGEMGLKLHPARFKELMAAQAATTSTSSSSTDKAL